jgi:plastocyanin
MRRGVAVVLATAVIAAAATGACGGGSPTMPTTPPSGAVSTTTITIANNTVSPKNIVVALGSQVTFVNNDALAHDMESNPHPDHTDCPAINQAGFLSPGQSRQTGNLNVARVCGYHDHNLDTVAGLQGTITVQ